MNNHFDTYKREIDKNASKVEANGFMVKKKYEFTESCVQERMMRLGIESRKFCPDNNDELFQIAVLSLIDDQCKSYLK